MQILEMAPAEITEEEVIAKMTKEEREIREYYRLHAEISGTNPYNLLASNGGPSDALGEDAKQPEKFKPKREYKAPTLFVSLPPGVPNKSTVKLHKSVLEKSKRKFSRGALHDIPHRRRDSDDDGGYHSLTAGLDQNRLA